MSTTIQQCVTGARGVLQDTVATYRFSDSDLTEYANDALGEIALRRPDLFSYFGDIPLSAGETYQTLPTGALRLMEIIRVKNGRSVKECTQDDLDQFNVNWHTAAAAATKNWIRHPRDPVAFYIYPKAPGGTTLVGQWAQSPTILVLANPIPVPDAYAPVIKDYIIWRAECRDDEYVSTPRAVLFMEAFNASLGLSAKTKATADSDVGNRDQQRALAALAQNNGSGAAGSTPAAQTAAQQSAAGAY